MHAGTIHPTRESAAHIDAIDLAKDVFEPAFAEAEHRIVARKRLARGPLAPLPR
jgi:transposase